MDTRLKVLIVEDSAVDTELMLNVLRDGGFAPDWKRIDTAKALRSTLKTTDWDVILCDHYMPDFGVPAALEVVKKHGMDIPFIIVSGVIKIADAIDMLKAGAHDFVDKDDLARLVPAVERELRDAEIRRKRKKSEQALRESEARFRELFEAAPVPIWVEDWSGAKALVDGLRKRRVKDFHRYFQEHPDFLVRAASACEILDVNAKTLEIYRATDKARFIAVVSEQYKQNPPETWGERLAVLAEGQPRVTVNTKGRRLDGSEFDIRVTTEVPAAYRDSWRRVLVIDEDITERKQAEEALAESEVRFRHYTETSSDYYWEMDENLRFSKLSERFTEFTGLPAEELLGRTREETGIPDIDPEIWRAHLADLAAHRPIVDFIQPRTHLDGKTVWLSVNALPVFDDSGIFKGYRGTGKDITEHKRAKDELRAAYEAVVKSEERFSNFADTASDWFWEMDSDLRFTYQPVEKGTIDRVSLHSEP